MLTKRLSGYGSEESQVACAAKNDLACWEREKVVWGVELVGGWRRRVVDMAAVCLWWSRGYRGLMDGCVQNVNCLTREDGVCAEEVPLRSISAASGKDSRNIEANA